jgi:hypothetical protein
VWIWQKCIEASRLLKSNRARMGSNAVIDAIQAFVSRIMELRLKKNTSCNRKRGKSPQGTIDIEDLAKDTRLIPPCVRNIINPNRGAFPKDGKREHFVRVARRGGLTLDVVRERLDVLNAKYPHSPPKNTKDRWDYVAHYTKDYSPVGCDVMPCCPFSGDMIQKKQRCHAQFKVEHPQKYRRDDAFRFYTPVAWILWAQRTTGNKKVRI